MPSEFDEEQMGAVATWCRAAFLLQQAERRCATLGLHPRGARAERAQFLSVLEKLGERDAPA